MISEAYRVQVGLLPLYSPDFNTIEQALGVFKRRRDFAPANTPVEKIVVVSGF